MFAGTDGILLLACSLLIVGNIALLSTVRVVGQFFFFFLLPLAGYGSCWDHSLTRLLKYAVADYLRLMGILLRHVSPLCDLIFFFFFFFFFFFLVADPHICTSPPAPAFICSLLGSRWSSG